MRENDDGAAIEKIFSERELLKRLFEFRRSLAYSDMETVAPAALTDLRNRLLELKMRDHEHCSIVERDLWAALYNFELDSSEKRIRRFEHKNFRRRIAAIGIINTAIESMIYFRYRPSINSITVPIEESIIKHISFFGTHLYNIAQENINIRNLFGDILEDADDE